MVITGKYLRELQSGVSSADSLLVVSELSTDIAYKTTVNVFADSLTFINASYSVTSNFFLVSQEVIVSSMTTETLTCPSLSVSSILTIDGNISCSQGVMDVWTCLCKPNNFLVENQWGETVFKVDTTNREISIPKTSLWLSTEATTPQHMGIAAQSVYPEFSGAQYDRHNDMVSWGATKAFYVPSVGEYMIYFSTGIARDLPGANWYLHIEPSISTKLVDISGGEHRKYYYYFVEKRFRAFPADVGSYIAARVSKGDLGAGWVRYGFLSVVKVVIDNVV